MAVLVPVKAFHQAKLRLAPALDQAQRAALAREMATNVVRAAGDLPVAVVCDDDEVAAWAATVGADRPLASRPRPQRRRHRRASSSSAPTGSPR